MVSWVTQAVDSMVSSDGGLFVAIAAKWLTNFAIFALVLIGLRMAYSAISHRHFAMDWATLGQFVFTFLICSLLLRYYNAPLPWGAVSFHQLFTENARFLSSYIDISNMNRVIAQIHKIVAGTERPSIWDPLSMFVYLWLLGEMFMLEAILFVITAYGFVATGVFVILGAADHSHSDVSWLGMDFLGLVPGNADVLVLSGDCLRLHLRLVLSAADFLSERCHRQLRSRSFPPHHRRAHGSVICLRVRRVQSRAIDLRFL